MQPDEIRRGDYYHHIDAGFLNRRLALLMLPPKVRDWYMENIHPESDGHLARLANDHLLVQLIIDGCDLGEVPTLSEALATGTWPITVRSTERLVACPEIYDLPRVSQQVILDVDYGKPVVVSYGTEHLVSSTGTMQLAHGFPDGYRESIIGRLIDRGAHFEIEPIVMGSPWLDHPRNPRDGALMWFSRDHGELLAEDIDQFSALASVEVRSAEEWMDVMRRLPERAVKEAVAGLLGEPTKKDWGGETNDHYSASLSVGGRRKTAAFLFKGPTRFAEMTLDMCGARADQVLRLVKSGADVSIIQHSHLIGEAVRETLRSHVVTSGSSHRKFCLIDGRTTFRILKAYGLLPLV